MAMPTAASARPRSSDESPRSTRSSPGRKTGRRISEIKDELGTTMNQHVAVFRDEAGLQQALEIVRRLKEEAKTAYIDDRGTVFNQDVLGAIELGYMLDCAEAPSSPRSSARSRAARSSAPTSPSATTRSGSSTSTSRATASDAPERRLLAGDDHPVAARGAEVLDGPMRRVHAPHPPLRPGVRRGAVLGRAHRSSSSRTARCSRASSRPRTRFDGSIGIRCSCHAAICGSCGVRVNGQPGLACHTHLDEALKSAPRTASSRSSRWATCPSSRT